MYLRSVHSCPLRRKNLFPIPPRPYAPKNLNMRMKTVDGSVPQMVLRRWAALTPRSLYMLSAHRCNGVHTSYMPIGEIN